MIQIFAQRKNNKILICIHDILDQSQSNNSREISINLTDYMISKFVTNGFDVFIGKNIDEILKESLSDNFYSHAVVIASGTSMKLSDRLVSEIDTKCREDFFIAGHVLDRGEKYFELHHQFFIINLDQYKETGIPLIGESSDETHIQLIPLKSESVVGDDYIPAYIQKGNTEKTYYGKMHGWNILSEGLFHNKKIIDIGIGIRNNKKYFYYEYDHVFIKESSDLIYNQFFFNNFVVPFNTDLIKQDIKFYGPVDQYITVGTGLNWVRNLKTFGYHDQTTVVFTDNNPLVIIFMKKLVKYWDGNDYMDFYLNNQENDLPNNISYDYQSYIDYNKTIWKSFIEDFPDWKNTWNEIKKLKFKFISIDYLANYNLNWVEKDKKTFFNVSDVFSHVPNIFLANLKYRIACENRLIQKLKDVDENITLNFSVRAAEVFFEINNTEYCKSVGDISLIDINKSNRRPYWHDQDWTSLRILT